MATYGVFLALLVGVGCGEDRPATRHASGSVAFRLAARHPSTALRARFFGDSALVAVGSDTIVIRRAELVLKDIQIAPTEAGECDPDEPEEACAPLAMGPTLIALPLGDGAGTFVTASVPAASYIVFHFALYAPHPERDRAFLATHPEFAGTSLRVQGAYSRSGARAVFTYASDFTEEHETGLLPPFAVAAGATANLTLRMDVSNWFLNAEKTALIAPASANEGGPNRQLVHDNIRTSVTAFRDDDQDGLDDAGESVAARPAEPWGAPPSGRGDADSAQFAAVVASQPRTAPPPRCRTQLPRLTSDSIGPFRLDESLAVLRRRCPALRLGWEPDPDGYPVPTVTARLGSAVVKALLTDTIPAATVRQVDVEVRGPATAEGMGVGSTLQQLTRAYGAHDASEAGCVLRLWFPTLPGLAFRMEFPARLHRECGGLSEPPLPPELRVAAVLLVPR